MKKTIIIVFQITCLLLMVSNHFLTLMLSDYINLYWFGTQIKSIVLDIVLYVIIGLQIGIIILLLEDVRNERSNTRTFNSEMDK